LSTDGLSAGARRLLGRLWRFRRPPHAFVLTEERLVHVALSREGGAPSVRACALPPGAFRPAPSGVPVAGDSLSQAVGSLLPVKGRIAAASLAVPDGFVKAAPVDVEPGVEKSPKELAEVLRWKVGRLYGEPVPALRIGWCAAGEAPGGGPRFLVLASPEETLASLEAAFSAHGIRIGALEPATLALSAFAAPALGGSGLVVYSDGRDVSTLVLEKGAVRFLRTRTSAAEPEEALQEVRLAASFAAGSPVEGPGPEVVSEAVVVPEGSPLAGLLRDLRLENGGRELVSLEPLLRSRGIAARAGDTAPIVGLGLLEGAE